MIRKSSPLGWLAVVLVGACGSKPELVTGTQEQDASAEASQDRLDSGTGIFFPDGTVQPDPGGCEAGSCTTRRFGSSGGLRRRASQSAGRDLRRWEHRA